MPGLAGRPGRRRPRRLRPDDPSRGPVRRVATTSCACSRSCSTRRPATGAPGSCRSSGIAGHRQEPARLGAREVHRRAGRAHLLAPGPIAGVRRGPRVLGARRDGPRSGADRRVGPARRRPGEARRRWPPSTSPTPTSGPASSRGSRPCSGSAAPATGSTEELTAAWRTLFERIADRGTDGPRLRGPPLGRPGPARLHRGPPDRRPQPTDPRPRRSPVRSSSTSGRRSGPRVRNHTRLDLAPLTDEAMDLLLLGLVPGIPPGGPPGDPRPGRRASRCTRSRRSGCCSTRAG